MAFSVFGLWYLSKEYLNLRLLSFLITCLSTVFTAAVEMAQREQPSCLHCTLCGGATFATPGHTKRKYNNLFEVENHLYHSVSITENAFYPGYKHLRCSVSLIFIYKQIIIRLKKEPLIIQDANYFECYKKMKFVAETIKKKLKAGLNHLHNLLITLYNDEYMNANERNKIYLKEGFSNIEPLTFQQTLFYLFLSMGDLHFNIRDVLLASSLKCPRYYEQNMLAHIVKATSLVQIYEISPSNKLGLLQLFSIHDTFFLPLLFNSTNWLTIYTPEELISFITTGISFLEDQQPSKSLVFKHIFLSCLINDIKTYNKKIYTMPSNFAKICIAIQNAEFSGFINQNKRIEYFINQLNNFEQNITNSSDILVKFCFNKHCLLNILQVVKDGLVNRRNGRIAEIIKPSYTSQQLYMNLIEGDRPLMVLNNYSLVMYIWKYTDFNQRRHIWPPVNNEYFGMYASDDVNPAGQSKYYQRIIISYMLTNYIFSLDGQESTLEQLETVYKHNMDGRVSSIYMLINYAVIISVLKNNSFIRLYEYIQRIETADTILPMFSRKPSPISPSSESLIKIESITV